MERKDFDKLEAEGVLPSDKHFITEDQLLEIWDMRGMKYRVDVLHQALLNRGLVPHVDQPKFRKMFYDIISFFLVEGKSTRDPQRTPRQRFPKVY